jgi:hypothetical protein
VLKVYGKGAKHGCKNGNNSKESSEENS